jgi:hypothetical protein
MRGIFLSTIFFLAATGSGLSQSIEKCDQAVLLETSKSMGSLSQVSISRFLQTFGKECRDDVGFSEWANELLFSALNEQTERTLIVLYKRDRSLELEEIFNTMRSPVDDLVSIDSLIIKVEKTNPVNPMRERVLDALKVAQAK